MATKRLTDYERKRIENIKRNEELLASLHIKSKLSDLSASAKRHRVEAKSYEASRRTKARSKTPIVVRKSLRKQGKSPDSAGLRDDDVREPYKKWTTLKSQVLSNKSPLELVPISMRDANACSESDETLVNAILSACKESRLTDDGGGGENKCRVRASVDLGSMELARDKIASVVRHRIHSIKFFPSEDLRMVVVGNQYGNLGFWNVNSKNEDGEGIYMYHPHPAPVSSILIHPFSLNKIITCCYGGLIRSLDVGKETFGLLHSSENEVFSMSQQPDDVNSIYFGEGRGIVSILDERSARSSLSWELHHSRINTIDFNSENTYMMATSSSDGTAYIWDLRKLGNSNPEYLMGLGFEGAVHSAYFSPSGGLLATISNDDKIGVLSGPNFEDEFIIDHYNASSRGLWGWDDSYIFVGNKNRRVDVISTQKKRLVTTLESPYLNAIPFHLDPHPCNPGMLAVATGWARVHIWSC